MLQNNDVTSQNFGNTVRRLSSLDVKQGAETIEVHVYALQELAKEIVYLWNLIKLKNNMIKEMKD